MRVALALQDSVYAPPMAAAEIPRLSASTPIAHALESLLEHGVLVLEDAADAAAVAALRSGLEPWFAAALRGRGPFFGRATRRFSGVFAKASATAGFAIAPSVLPLVEAVLRGSNPQQPRCDQIELNLTQAIAVEPGEPSQILHRDDELWPFDHDYELMVNVMWPIDAFTDVNGATRLAPGSHRWPRTRAPLPGEVVAAAARPGSAIVWLGSVIHGGGENRSSTMRRGLVFSYRLGWLAGAERLQLSTPPAVAAALPERLQRLIGYQLHRPNLGWVEGRDPLLWLRGEVGTLAAADDNLTAAQERHLQDALGAPPNTEVTP